LFTVPGTAVVTPLSVLRVVVLVVLCAIAGATASARPATAANVRVLMVFTSELPWFKLFVRE
jgi:hypothetical protein